jgi:polyphosphate glucokinase
MNFNLPSSTKCKQARAAPKRAAGSSINRQAASRSMIQRVLVIDIGGHSVKILATEQHRSRSFPSGRTLTPQRMVDSVRKLAAEWRYDVVSIGYPGPVLAGQPIAEPYNLGCGWVGFDFARAFGRPVRLVNDAAMQALGSYKGGKMLFLGLGTGLGTAMIVDGAVAPMEIGHLPYENGTYEDYVGRAGLKRHGKKKWRRHVADVVERLVSALQPDDTVIGGGNVTKLRAPLPHCRKGNNADAFRGGFALWAQPNVLPLNFPRECGRVQRRLSRTESLTPAP